MKNLTETELKELKRVLFIWLNSDISQEWATAAQFLVKLGEISTQEATQRQLETQSEALKVLQAAMEKEEKTPLERGGG